MYDGHHACIFCFTSVHACIRITVTANRCAGGKIKIHPSPLWIIDNDWHDMIRGHWEGGYWDFHYLCSQYLRACTTMIIVADYSRTSSTESPRSSRADMEASIEFIATIFITVNTKKTRKEVSRPDSAVCHMPLLFWFEYTKYCSSLQDLSCMSAWLESGLSVGRHWLRANVIRYGFESISRLVWS